ncbi:MAG TPA: hypothetical protein VJN39_13050 [Gemmatimonadales bacterium]|nr:hypothetical protein [Gemmatimonadales bacterium]
MPPRCALTVLAVAAAVTTAVFANACNTTTGLPAAAIANVIDSTVSLYAIRGTPISTPSAYSLAGRQPVLIQDAAVLDFAFDFDSIGEPALFPTGAIHFGVASGLQRSTTPFDGIKIAPTGTYIFDKPIALDTGTVVIVSSRPTACVFGVSALLYAKLRVIRVDSTARRLDFQILVDQNCGYRGLEPGLPTQ